MIRLLVALGRRSQEQKAAWCNRRHRGTRVGRMRGRDVQDASCGKCGRDLSFQDLVDRGFITGEVR